MSSVSNPAPSARLVGFLLVLPALAVIVGLFLMPLAISVIGAFRTPDGWGLANFTKSADLYSIDVLYTVGVIGLSTLLIGLLSIAIGGYLTLGENPRAVALLRWLYRWPLFIPFIVVGQMMRTFLAKNGLMNNVLVAAGLMAPLDTVSFLDWRGIVISFVWKQTPLVALLVAGAMASLDRGTIEAARNLGAGRLRILVEIVVPQVMPTLLVGLTLSFVTMMSVLSVPLMVASQSPTVITADIAFRINAYADYGVANALGVISLVITGGVAWFYLRHTMRERL
ncbi:MAG: ABC transporter permease subunit [Rhodobacteraceae bacterium]|nr:ABC transporter permease subunit [Paracoccaceae bacterium]